MLNNEITKLNEEVIELQEEKNSETKDIKNQWLKNRLE